MVEKPTADEQDAEHATGHSTSGPSVGEHSVPETKRSFLPVVAGVALFLGASLFAASNLFGAFESTTTPASGGAGGHGGHGGGGKPGGGADKSEKVTPVKTVVVEEGALTSAATIPGEVLSGRRVDLRARSTGTLLRLKKRLGETVRAGELLGWMDTGTLGAEVKRAEALVGVASARARRTEVDVARIVRDVERKTRLEEGGAASRVERERLEHELALAKADLEIAHAETKRAAADLEILKVRVDETRFVVPFDGRIARLHVDEGAALVPGQAVASLVSDDARTVQFSLRTVENNELAAGAPVEVLAGETIYAGVVTNVGAEIDPANRTILVEARLNDALALLPGTFVKVRVALGATEASLLVPEAALVGRGPERTVFIVEDDHVRAVPTKVLLESQDRAAVVGPKKGARVVVEGRDQVKDGAKVEVVQ